MSNNELVVFALGSSRAAGERIVRHLNLELGALDERDFEDGEHKTRSLENVRNKDVFVVHSLYSEPGQSVNDKVCRLLFFIGSLHDAGAGRVTAVTPYLCYGRKDRKTKPRDPVTTRYLAQMFEAVRVDRVMAMDVHNLAAFQNAFRCQTDHLEARPLFVEHFAARVGDDPVVVVSPDAGGMKRVDHFREALGERLGRQIPSAFLEKRRSEGVVTGDALVGDVEGKTAIILDDLISSGTTLARAARTAKQRGAAQVYAAATHGVFVEEADRVLIDPALERTVICDTIPPLRLSPQTVENKLLLIDTSRLFAEAIARAHQGGSITDLLEL